MKSRKKRKLPIKDLLDREEEKPGLEQIYIEHAVAVDQLRRDQTTLSAITSSFNRSTGRNIDESTLLRYMLNRRKDKDWPRLGSKAKKFQSVLKLLPPAHLETLKRIYLDLDITSDRFLMDPDLMEKLARRFQEETGKRVKGNVLVGVIIAQRKRGLWIKISEPFADIEVIAKQSAS